MNLDTIQYRTVCNTLQDLIEEIRSTADAGIKTFRVPEVFMNALQDESFNDLKFIVDLHSIAEVPQHFGVHYKASLMNDEIVPDTRNLTGATANTILNCKNFDLKGFDYLEVPIDLGVNSVNHKNSLLGSEGLQALLPKEMEYGWMLLSLATPVMASGIKSFSELELLAEQTAVHGVVLDQIIYSSPDKKRTVKEIQSLFEISQPI